MPKNRVTRCIDGRWVLLVGALLVIKPLAGCDVRELYPPCAGYQPSPTDVEAAKGAHVAATRFYDTGRYQAAIDIWAYAYKLDCTAHGLLINIGRAKERLGRNRTAIDIFALYVERAGATADPKIVEIVKAARAAEERGSAPLASQGPRAPLPAQPKPKDGEPKPEDGEPKPEDGQPKPEDGQPKPDDGEPQPPAKPPPATPWDS